MAGSLIPNTLLEAYRAARYVARIEGDEISLAIGCANPDLARALVERGRKSGCFITAWNPFGQACDAGANAVANEQLLADLQARGWDVFVGEGRDVLGEWPAEASFLVMGPGEDDAAALCAAYSQNAVVVFAADGVPHLLLHPGAEPR